MARRQKSEKTRFRTSTKVSAPKRYKIKRQTNRKETERKTQNLGGIGTVILSLCLLIAIIVWNSVRGSIHKPADDNLRVHFIDVGQGDCIYISCGGENMLIDCGEHSEADKVIGYLYREGVDTLDYVIATHPHSDHMGGMSEIIGCFEVGEVIIPPLTTEAIPVSVYFEKFLDAVEDTETDLVKAEVGMKKSIGDAEFRIISPWQCDSENLNNCSVGVILKHGKNNFCFTGDAEAEAEEKMVLSGVTENVDVYKAAHHGSDTSNTDLFLTALSPEIVVVSCGAGNSYGHPVDSVMKRFDNFADQIYRTDLDGTVVISSDGKELEVSTERNNSW